MLGKTVPISLNKSNLIRLINFVYFISNLMQSKQCLEKVASLTVRSPFAQQPPLLKPAL